MFEDVTEAFVVGTSQLDGFSENLPA